MAMTLREFFSIVELRTKVVSVSSLLIGTLTAVVFGVSTSWPQADWLAFAVFAVAVLLVDMGTTAFNSFFDHWSGTDRRGRNFERDKVLVHRRTPSGYALLTGMALYGAAAVLGLVLAVLSSFWLVPIGAAGMLVGFLYSGGPRPIATTPFGEVFAGTFLGGGLVVLSVYVLTGRVDSEAILMSVPSTLAVAAILTVNNTCDLESDRDSGRLTLSILIGVRASTVLIAVLFLGAYAWAGAVLWGRAGWLPLVPLVLGAGGFVGIYRRLVRRGFALTTKGPSMGGVVQAFALFTAALGGALGLVFI